jgi:NAD-dependent dihydropyrimidine dehydrogenase PreA subunit
VVDDLAELDQDLCQGCGLCVTRCPVRALEMP